MTEKLLFKLLSCELWGKSFDEEMSLEVFEAVMQLAHQQTVTGLVLNPIPQSQLNDSWTTLSKYISRSLKIQKRNTIINHELADFATQCKDKGIDYIVVKGQTIGIYYPHPMIRMSGDIDFLIKDDYATAKGQLEQRLEIQLPPTMVEKEISFQRNGTLYELHVELVEFGNKRNQQLWSKLIAKAWQKEYCVAVEGTPIRTLPPTLNVVYTFYHLFHHFIREGVALRQFCDWAILLHHLRNEINRDELAEILRSLDIDKAYRAFGWVLIERLGLPEQDFPLPIEEKDKRWAASIVKHVLSGGNFGKDNHKAETVGLRFKLETLWIVIKHSIKYYPLAPTEIRMMIPKLIMINVNLLRHKTYN